jgi:hypothetical protein
MSTKFDPNTIRNALVSPRWTGLVRVDTPVEAIARWDPLLLRHSRVLVPVDVQALYVPAGDTTKFVRLPCGITTPDNTPPEPMPDPLADGVTRDPGVYLQWTPPDALLRGTLQPVPDGSTNRLGMPALPDRWVVIRILAPTNGTAPVITGWALEADTAKAIPLGQWPAASAATPGTGKSIANGQLTGSVGGSVNWTGIYDASVNRFSFYDPLTDLAAVAPNGVVDNLGSYVVGGWYSDATLDPLDVAQTEGSLAVRLADLNWSLMTDSEGGDQVNQNRSVMAARRDTLNLKTAARYAPAVSEPAVSAGANPKIVEAMSPVAKFTPLTASFSDSAAAIIATEPRWPRASLMNGVVFGVPVAGPVVADQRPDPAAVDLALGHHGDDVAAVLAASGLGVVDPDERRAMERLLSAFTGQVLAEMGTADGVVDTEEHQHGAGFTSLPGGPGTVERLRKGAETGPLSMGRSGRSEAARIKAAQASPVATKINFRTGARTELYKATLADQRTALTTFDGTPPVTEPKVEVREVTRPAPRYYIPLDPMLAVRSAKRSLRYASADRFSHDGKVQCLWPSQLATTAPGLLDGRDYVPSLPTGAVPDEVLLLVQHAVISDPYLVPWLSAIESRRRGIDPGLILKRMSAESAVRFGTTAVYDGTTAAFQPISAPAAVQPAASFVARAQISDQLRRFSMYSGVDLSPVAVTTWSQPWAPLWLEWEVEFRVGDRLDGWTLSQTDLDVAQAPPALTPQTFRGRATLHTGTAKTLAASIQQWLLEERQRDQNNTGEIDDATAQALSQIAGQIGYLDVVTGSFDGLNEELLGLPVDPFGILTKRAGDVLQKPVPAGPPTLLAGGELRLKRARLVDAFGRTLDLPADQVKVVARDEKTGPPSALLMRPRIQRPARWLFRLVDPTLADLTPGAGDANGPAEATVDQINPEKMINPVSGFLLPDHIDESLEAFDTAGQPLGQLMHEPFGGGVTWEIAPGRSGPSDAGPGFDLQPTQRIVGLLAAGMVAADAQTREGKPAGPDDESALSAFLRAIDTTLWTVDTFAPFGNEHIAGLVGRPVAVVRATLRLDIDDDLDEVDLSDASQLAERQAAYRDLADRAFPIRLGELTRSDDGLLGFFVDDDYAHYHVVDKVIRDAAFDVRRGRGQLNQLGLTQQMPDIKPIKHPYIVAEDELLVRPGQVMRLTLLMHPASRVHLTSGVLPRKYLQLAHDWVQPGLAVMAPSARIGPVLIDPDKVRLPKISSFPKDQIWTRRSNPATWKDDPILAATQTALFPDMPSEVQEGYIRIAPKPAGDQS